MNFHQHYNKLLEKKKKIVKININAIYNAKNIFIVEFKIY